MTGSRVRSRRLGAILLTALFTIALVPGLTSAADTRLLTISMSQPTRVSVPAPDKGPYATMFEVRIANDGGQNLAHTVLTIDANATDDTELSLVTSYDPDGGDDASSTFCTTTGTTIVCDYASLSAGAARTVAVVVAVTSAYDATPPQGVLFSASATTNNENGSNQQTFTADSGSFAVEATEANTLATFVLDGIVGQNLSTGNTGGSNKLNTNVTFNTANKELVQINEGDSQTLGLYACPAGLSCQPDFSEVTTTSGSFANSPFFTWKLTAIVPKTYALSQGFVAHYPTGATSYVPGAPGYWTLLFKNKSALCGTDIDAKIASAHQCIKTLSLTKLDRTSNLLVVEVVMDHQGGMKL